MTQRTFKFRAKLTKNTKYNRRFEIDIKLQETEKGKGLSICGSTRNQFGQIADCIRELMNEGITDYPNGWDKRTLARVLYIWDAWHLNDTRAGTVKQTAILRPWMKANPGKDYTEQCNYLFSHGLLIDDGYKYGSAWLFERLPDDVAEFITNLLTAE